VKYIDAHAHLVHNHQRFHELAVFGEFDETWLMDLNGLTLNDLTFASTQEVLAAAKAHPQTVYAFGHLDFSRSPDEIDRLQEMGFTGLKPYKPRTGWNDQRYYPFYERAEKLGMPIVFHTGIVASIGNDRLKRNPEYGFGPEGMRPSHLAGIAEAFPKLKIHGGHLGYPWLEETIHNLYFYPNICHDISGYRHPELLAEFVRNLDRMSHDGTGRGLHEKVFFATDRFYGVPEENALALKFKEFWKLYFELIFSIYCRWGSPQEAEKFFSANARKWRSGK